MRGADIFEIFRIHNKNSLGNCCRVMWRFSYLSLFFLNFVLILIGMLNWITWDYYLCYNSDFYSLLYLRYIYSIHILRRRFFFFIQLCYVIKERIKSHNALWGLNPTPLIVRVGSNHSDKGQMINFNRNFNLWYLNYPTNSVQNQLLCKEKFHFHDIWRHLNLNLSDEVKKCWLLHC